MCNDQFFSVLVSNFLFIFFCSLFIDVSTAHFLVLYLKKENCKDLNKRRDLSVCCMQFEEKIQNFLITLLIMF